MITSRSSDLPRARLGRTALEVTRIGLGSAPLGGLVTPVNDAEAAATIESAWALGIRHFDTAPLYGFGLAERRLGRFLKTQPRESFVLSTKVGRLLRRVEGDNPSADRHYKGTPPERPVFDFSHDGVRRSVEESLARLGLDRIDILYIHDPDDHYEQAHDGAFAALDRLRHDGSVGAIGVGMNQHQMLARFAEAAPFDRFLLAGIDQALATQGAPELDRDRVPRGGDARLASVTTGWARTNWIAAALRSIRQGRKKTRHPGTSLLPERGPPARSDFISGPEARAPAR